MTNTDNGKWEEMVEAGAEALALDGHDLPWGKITAFRKERYRKRARATLQAAGVKGLVEENERLRVDIEVVVDSTLQAAGMEKMIAALEKIERHYTDTDLAAKHMAAIARHTLSALPTGTPATHTEEAVTVGGWRTMESVPKDGTVFIALTPKGVCRCRWTAVDWGEHPSDPIYHWWEDPDGNLFFEDGPHDSPTHWMPEPGEAPTPSPSEREERLEAFIRAFKAWADDDREIIDAAEERETMARLQADADALLSDTEGE